MNGSPPAASALLACLLVPSLSAAQEAPPGPSQVALAGRLPLEGAVVAETPSLLTLDCDGWTVEVPQPMVLSIRDADGSVRLPSADAAEDLAWQLASRGDLAAAIDAHGQAVVHTLRALAAGAVDPHLGSARLEVSLQRVDYLALRSGEARRALPLVEAILGMPGPTPLCRDVAVRQQARLLRMLGRRGQADAAEAALGLLTAWYVIGPFDNERGTGMDVVSPPETDAFDPLTDHAGKKHRVRWRPLPVESPPDGVVDLDALMSPDDQALAYAVTYVHAEAPCAVALRLGSDEAVKAWVNRELVLNRSASRPYAPDQEAVGVVLRAGWNQVLLKVGDQTGGWAFRARLTDPDGGPARGVRMAALAEVAEARQTATAPQVGPPAPPPAIDGGARAALAAHVEAAPADARAWAHLGYLRWTAQAHDRSEHREALERAAELLPENAHLRVLLALASGGSGEFSVNREDNARRAALEAAIALDPGHALARTLLARHYHGLGNRDRARAIITPALEQAPNHVEARLLALQLDRARDLAPLVEARLRELFQAAEERVMADEASVVPAPLLRAMVREARQANQVQRRRVLLEMLLEVDREDVAALRGLAGIQDTLGNVEAAALLLRQAAAVRPFSTSLWVDLARLHERHGQLDRAMAAYARALTHQPHDVSVMVALGHLEDRRGNPGKADHHFDLALDLDPSLGDLREYLAYRARNTEREPAFEDAWAVDPAPLVEAARATPLDPRRPRRVLFRQHIDRLGTDGTKSRFIQDVIRAENEVGARALITYAAPFSSDQRIQVQKATLFRADGTSQDVPVGSSRGGRGGEFTSGRSYRVRFPPLEPGDAIAVRFRVDDLVEGFFGDYYGERVFFQSDTAVDWFRYAVIVPKGRTLHFHTPGLSPEEHVRRDQGDAVVHLFERKGIPPLETEPDMPWAKEVLPQVQVSTFADWDAFARWYWNLVKGQHEADDGIRAKVKELLAGAETEEEKVRRIYHYVITDIRYNASWEFGIHGFKPYNATKIYARKFGDCKDKATLIGTMLGEAGIDAWPVLIFGEDARGREDLTLPLMSHFNHCISWVDLGREGTSKGLFLDGTAEHHPYPTLPTMDYGATVVGVTPEGGVLREIPFLGPETNVIRERHVVRLDPKGEARLSSRIDAEGRFGVVLRDALSNEARQADVLEPQLGRAFGGVHVTRVQTSDLSDLNAPVRVEVDADLPAVLRETPDGSLELEPVRSWLWDLVYLRGRKVSAMAADDQRTHDVILSVPSAVEEEVVYELPPAARIERIPAKVELDHPFGRYRLEYERDGPRLKLRRRFELKVQRVPVEDYPALRSFFQAIDRAEAERPRIAGEGADQ
jgi:tetratricopeptide (TPR) repeat protein